MATIAPNNKSIGERTRVCVEDESSARSTEENSQQRYTRRRPTPGSRQKLVLERDLLAKDNPVVKVGSIRFPTSHEPKPSKWACVKSLDSSSSSDPTDVDEENRAKIAQLCNRLFGHAWKLPAPTVLISVYGCEWEDESMMREADVLQQGLADAVRTTRSWVITAGRRRGISALVGSAMSNVEGAVCIGIGPKSAVVGHERLMAQDDGVVYRYACACTHARHTAPLLMLTYAHAHEARVTPACCWWHRFPHPHVQIHRGTAERLRARSSSSSTTHTSFWSTRKNRTRRPASSIGGQPPQPRVETATRG